MYEHIVSGNEIIAKFMGCKLGISDISHRPVYIIPQYSRTDSLQPDGGDEFEPVDMQYHNSWDWLMPVIREIGHLGEGHILDGGKLNPIKYDLLGVRIFAAWEQVVAFIKWYYEDKKTKDISMARMNWNSHNKRARLDFLNKNMIENAKDLMNVNWTNLPYCVQLLLIDLYKKDN